MSETVVTFACCSKNKIHKMFQTEQKMNIRHEQANNWFTIPRFKLKTKTCGKWDTSGRRGLFHMDQSRLLFSREWRKKTKCAFTADIIFTTVRESLVGRKCVCVSNKYSYPTRVAEHLKSVMRREQVSHWGVISPLETVYSWECFFFFFVTVK